MAAAEEEGAKGLGQGSPPFQKQFLSVMSSILRCSGCILVFSVSSLVSISCVPSHPWSTFMQVSAWFLMSKMVSGSYVFLLLLKQSPLTTEDE